MRAFIAGAALLVLGAALGRRLPSEARIWTLLAMTGLGATTLAFLGMFHAAEFISPGMATVIANTQPLMAAVLAHAYLGERLERRGKVGLALAFAGIVVIVSPGLLSSTRANSTLGFAYILLAAVGVTVSNVLIKRLAGTVDPLMAMGTQLVLGGVPLALLAVLTEAPETTQWSAQFTLVLLALSLLGTSLVYWLWFSLLASVELNKANAFSFLIPVFGIAMGVAFFGEGFGWQDAVGAGLTVLGLDLVIRRPRIVGARSNSADRGKISVMRVVTGFSVMFRQWAGDPPAVNVVPRNSHKPAILLTPATPPGLPTQTLRPHLFRRDQLRSSAAR